MKTEHSRRKTWRGVPRYEDEIDVFILSGAGDLVPVETSPNVTRYCPEVKGYAHSLTGDTQVPSSAAERCRVAK